MDRTQAKELLQLHSFAHSNIEHPKMATGFLGSLRPYTGLKEENFHEVMQAIITLAPEIQKEKEIDRDIIKALWAICELARAWGIHPKGMLRSNNLIALKDVSRLEQWIDTITYAVLILLDGGDLEAALEFYKSGESWHD